MLRFFETIRRRVRAYLATCRHCGAGAANRECDACWTERHEHTPF
jgi:hypothetical protein